MEVGGAVRDKAVPATVDSGPIYFLTALSLHVGIAAETALIRARCAIHEQSHGFANKMGIARRVKLALFGTTGAANASYISMNMIAVVSRNISYRKWGSPQRYG